jgi:hypothetical protein
LPQVNQWHSTLPPCAAGFCEFLLHMYSTAQFSTLWTSHPEDMDINSGGTGVTHRHQEEFSSMFYWEWTLLSKDPSWREWNLHLQWIYTYVYPGYCLQDDHLALSHHLLSIPWFFFPIGKAAGH